MRTPRILATVLAICLAAGPALALSPGAELWVPAAARGLGADGSFWVTDLVLMNPNEAEITVTVEWLARGADNSDPVAEEITLAGGETLVLADVISETFGLDAAAGAFRVEVGELLPIIATTRIYSGDGDATFGQGFEGIPTGAEISEDGPAITHAVGVTDDQDFRTNWYGVCTDEEGGEFRVEVLDRDGTVLATDDFELLPFSPVLMPIADLGAGTVEGASIRFTALSGGGIFGASTVDRHSNDPTTVESHWNCGGDISGFTDEFRSDDCTFASTGSHPYYIPLQPGARRDFEGEEDGETIHLRITVLNDTRLVDGVETRVLEEYETVDGEVVEVARNYVAICTETGSVFYFGEDVDIYEDGEIVSHDGAWLAGENGAEPGILMPGTVLLASRYYQEIAPGVALDQAEHVSMDETVETPAGTFSDCLQVRETTPLAPGDISFKFYAPGTGLVRDGVVELVSISPPPTN